MGFSVSTFITIDAPNLQVVGTASAVLYGFDENEEEYGEPDIRFDTLTMDGADVQTSSAAGDGPFEVNYNLQGSLSYSGVYTIAGSATATVELWDEPDWIGHDSDTRFATYNGPTCSSPVITGIQIMPQGQTQTQPTSGLLVNSSGTLLVNAACIDSSAQLSVNSSDVMLTPGGVSNGTVLATYTVPQGAQPGSRTLTLTTTSNGASTSTTIEIAPSLPYIDTISPDWWQAGQSTCVTITGAGFGGGSGQGATPGMLSVTSNTMYPVSLVPASALTPGNCRTGWSDNSIYAVATTSAGDPGQTVTISVTGGDYGMGFQSNPGRGLSNSPSPTSIATVGSAPAVSVTSVQFTNSYLLAADDGHTNPPPVIDTVVWRATCAQPPCMNPSAFQNGTRIAANVTIQLSQPSPAQLQSVRVEGTVPGLGTISGKGVIGAGSQTGTIFVTDDTALPSGTKIYNPMTITWKVSLSDPLNSSCNIISCQSAGASASTVYVTMATPPTSNLPLPLTTLGLAVAGGGATSSKVAFQNTWAKFSTNGGGPANVTAWDGRSLYYYPPGQKFTACATNSVLLLNVDNGYGQCGSFRYLLRDALQVNGIYMDLVTIASLNSDQFLVKSWAFGGPGADQAADAPYSWPVTLQDEGPAPGGGEIYGMVPLPVGSLFGQIVSLPDLHGQNTAPPSEKIFAYHFILKDTFGTSGAGPYYDPSYGVTYLNACDPSQGFEVKAVDGYLRRVGFDAGPNYHAEMNPNTCNIFFSK
jgi:hypothetical protein